MLFSLKNIIDGTIDQSIKEGLSPKQTLRSVQIAQAFSSQHYFLIALTVGSFMTFLLMNFVEIAVAPTAIWASLGLVYTLVLATASILIYRQKKLHDSSLLYRFLKVMYTLLGLNFALGFALNIWYFGLFAYPIHISQAGLILFFVIVTQMVISFSNGRILLGLIFLATSWTPVLFYIALKPEVLSDHWVMYLCSAGYLLYTLGALFEYKRIRDNFSQTYIDHYVLMSKASQQRQLLENLNAKLSDQISKRNHVEKQLQDAKTYLEERIEQRTKKLKIKNTELLKTSQNLKLVQDAAGISSWEWDPSTKIFTSSNQQNALNEDLNQSMSVSTLIDRIHPDDKAIFLATFNQYLKNHPNPEPLKIEFRICSRSGSIQHIESSAMAIDNHSSQSDQPMLAGIWRDISDEKQRLEDLKLSSSVFEYSAEAIFVLDSNLNFLSVNPSFEKILACKASDVINTHFFIRPPKQILPGSSYDQILKDLRNKGEFSGVVEEYNFAGKRITMQISITKISSEAGASSRYVGIMTDITDQKNNEKQLSYLANYDALTDLPNRRHFNNELHKLININSEHEKFAVLRLNIDRFRVVNSSLGSKMGDELISMVAKRLSSIEIDTQSVARFGGDDFAVLICDLSLNSLKAYYEAVFEVFSRSFLLEDQEVNLRVSIGASLYPLHGRQVDVLINRAEQGLKRAKLDGGDSFVLYSQNTQVSSLEKLKLENELRRGIAHGELVVYYQPKIDLKTKLIYGFEALVRWQHPTSGLLSPDNFLPLATESGLINELGAEVLNQTCRQIQIWKRAGNPDIRVAVNVEAQQLKRNNFLEILDSAMERYEILGENLELEITETSLLDMPEKIKNLLEAIKLRRIKVSLDDFGTGYSSLSYLSQYPIDVLKIDRSFILKIGTNEQSDAIVRAIIAMGHSLQIEIVAEGVETSAQVEFLESEGCQIAQGFYFGRPAPAQTASALIDNMARLITQTH